MGSDLFTDAKPPPQYAQSAELLDALNNRLLLLSNQFENFMTLTTSLQAQHDAAQCTILNLQAKVVELEDKVKTSQTGQEEVISASISAATAVVASAFAVRDAQTPAKSDTEKATLEQLMTDWKKNVDGQWSSMREEWSEERARLAKASEEWEAKIKQVDSKLGTLNAVRWPAGQTIIKTEIYATFLLLPQVPAASSPTHDVHQDGSAQDQYDGLLAYY